MPVKQIKMNKPRICLFALAAAIVRLIRAASPKGTSKEAAQPSMPPKNNTDTAPF